MHQILTEAVVRQMRFREGKKTIYAEPGAFITKEAREYIRAMRMTLIEADTQKKPSGQNAAAQAAGAAAQTPPVNRAIRPIEHKAGSPRFTNALTGEAYAEKPEQMTHLRGTQLVPKTHPVIRLRGKLDSLEAKIIQQAVRAREEGRGQLVRDLDEMLGFARAVLTAEVMDAPMAQNTLLGMDEAALRRVSQNPQQELGRGHILPTVQLSWVGAALNSLRADAREVELAAADAFFRPDGSCERTDLIRSLNRMSSAFYIMMFYELDGRYEPAQPGKDD